MSEKKLIDLGAECVCGDLILNQKTVGLYRDGSFRLTDDGRAMLQQIADDAAAPQPVVPPSTEAAEPAPARAPRAPKTAKSKTPVEAPAEPEAAPAESGSTEDLLADLDRTLGE